MAHNINITRKGAAIFTVAEPAWHGLGSVVESALTSQEAIIESKLDYEITKCETYAKFDPPHPLLGRGTQIDNTFALARVDTGDILTANGTLVTSAYEIVQNVEVFDFIDEMIGNKQAIFHTAGALGKGETIFISAKLPDYIRIQGSDDIIENYLLLTSSHDGKSSLTVMFTPIRVVCQNTLSAAIHGSTSKLRFRHTGSIKEKLSTLKASLNLVNLKSKDTEMFYNKLATTPIKDNEVSILLAKAFLKNEMYVIENQRLKITEDISSRQANILNDIANCINLGLGQDFETCKGTLYGVYCGVSYYFQNFKSYKSDDHKFISLTSGQADNTLIKLGAICEDFMLQGV
jgi:phage/plasmid-like protein (TIGR03299 family)